MEADPYSDGILKSPIVIDNVRNTNIACAKTLQPNYNSIHYFKDSGAHCFWLFIGFRYYQGRLWWRGAPAKDIQLIVRFHLTL